MTREVFPWLQLAIGKFFQINIFVTINHSPNLGLQICISLLEIYVHRRQLKKFCEEEMPNELAHTGIVTQEEFSDH
jgi:hypothetical protein